MHAFCWFLLQNMERAESKKERMLKCMGEEEKRYLQNSEESMEKPIENASVIGESQPEENTTTSTVKKKSLIILVAVLAALIVVGSFLLVKGKGGTTATGTDNVAIKAKITTDGTAYIPLYNGKTIEIQGDVQKAWLTKNKKRVITLQKDGTLYVTDLNQSEKNVIADNATDIISVRDDGIIYEDEAQKAYRVVFKDFSVVELGEDISVVVASHTLSALYATGKGDIYILAADKNEANKVDTFDYQVRLKDISDDGKLAVWTDKKGSDYRVVLNVSGESTTLGKVTPTYSQDYTSVFFTKDQKMAVISSSLSDHLWIKQEGKDVVDVNLGATLATNAVYTQDGDLSESNATSISALYVKTEGNSEGNLYRITLTGERDRVVSGVGNFEVIEGKVFYTNADDNLYYAQLNGTDLKEEEKIASDVSLFEVEGNGKYVYYVKDSGALYCYKTGEKEPVKIAAEVATLYGIITYNRYSADGSTVFYYTELEDIKETYDDYGTLMMWSYGESESTKISSEVLTSTMSSGLKTGAIDKNCFTFLKYDSVNSKGDVCANWMYNDGKENEKIAANVIA